MPLRIVAFNSELPNVLEDSTGRKIEFTSILTALEFLSEPFERVGERDLFRVAWDIDELMAPIFRLLNKTEAQTLLSTNKLQLVWQLAEGSLVYQIKYTPEKLLIIKRMGEELDSVIFHLRPFSPDDFEPKDVGQVKGFALAVVATARQMGFEPHNLYSPASVISTYLERLDLPQPEQIPLDASLYALRCVDKDWRETHIIGLFPDSYRYDLKSAFPTVHANLIDYRYGRWLFKTSYDPTAYYGYCRCQISIRPQVKISPIIYRNLDAKEGEVNLYSPVGTWEDFITLDEVKFIEKWRLGTATVLDAWYFYPGDVYRQPMKIFIERLQRSKEEGGALTKHIAKAFLVSAWGKTRQVKEYRSAVGELFNPPWAAIIKTRPRLTVAECLYRHKVKPIQIVTDGFGCQDKIDLTHKEREAGWREDFHGDALVVSTGLGWYSTKHPGSLTLKEVKGMIEEEPKASYWHKQKKKTVTLGDALKFNDLTALGTKRMYRTVLDLNSLQHNRYFAKVPKTGKELLEGRFTSTPYEVGEDK